MTRETKIETKNEIGSVHRTVLLKETIDGMNISGNGDGKVILDATFGGGGHTVALLEKYKGVKVIAIDAEQEAWNRVEKKLENLKSRISFHNDNFRNMDKILAEEGLEKIDGVIFDLGLSSDEINPQNGVSGRGFSFMRDEPLIMTMKENPSSEDLTAEDVVNDWSEDSLQKIISGYGEEKFAKRIARGIAEEREKGRIKTTSRLVRAIENSVPAMYRRGRIHFATRTFQAIRIAVNDELGALAEGLKKSFEALREGGRMAVIAFHSLEDRPVKRFTREKQKEGRAKILNKRPIVPEDYEKRENPRARSAKLRIIEKII